MSVNNILSFELYQQDDNYKYYDVRLSAFTGPFVSNDGFEYTGHTQNFTSSWPEIVPTSYSSESVCIQSIRLSTTFNQTNTTLIYDRSDITSENTKEWDGSSWVSKPNLLSATTAPYRLYWNGANIRLSEYKSPPRPTSDTPWEFLTGTRSENLQNKVLFSIRVDNTVSLTSTNVLYNITLFGSHLSTGIAGERHWGPINSEDPNGYIDISSVPDQIQVNIVENINNSPVFLSKPNIYGRIDQLYRYNIQVTDQDQDQVVQRNITETTQYSIIRNGEINVLEFGLIPNAEHLINSNFDSSQIEYDFIVSGVNGYGDDKINYISLPSNKNYFYHVVSENGNSVNYQSGDIGWVWGLTDKYMVSSNNFSERFQAWVTENNVSNIINNYNSWDLGRAGFILDFEKHNVSASVNKVSYFIKDTRSGRYNDAWDIWGVNRNGEVTLINTTENGILLSGHHLIEFSNSNYYSKYVFVTNETTNIAVDTRMMFTKFNAFGETTKSEPLTINSPSLPAWLTLTDNRDNTGILEGTPSANDLDSTINLQVTDNQGVVIQQSFDIRIVPTDFPMFNTEVITSVSEYVRYNCTIEVIEYQPIPTINTTTQYTVNHNTNGDIYVSEFGLIPNAEHLNNTDFDSNKIDYDFIVSGVNSSAFTYKHNPFSVVAENRIPYQETTYGTPLSAWHWGKYGFNEVESSQWKDRIEIFATENNIPDLLNKYKSWDRALVGFILDFVTHGKKGLVNKISYRYVQEEETYLYENHGWDIWAVNHNGELKFITRITEKHYLSESDSPIDYLMEINNSRYYEKYVFLYDGVYTSRSKIDRIFNFNVFGDTIPVENANIPQYIIGSHTLPSWLTLTDNGDNTAILSGTPTENDIGINNVIIESNNATALIPLLQTFDINVVNNTTTDLLFATENGIKFNGSIVSGTEFVKFNNNVFSDNLHFVYNGTHYNSGTNYAELPAAVKRSMVIVQ